MIEPGIYTTTYAHLALEQALDAIAAHGIGTVQFNLGTAGLPDLVDAIDPALIARIRGALEARRITMAAVSGTFNMIDPDLERRRRGVAWLGAVAGACAGLGTSLITLCTGTRDPHSMWRRHPDNASPAAWRDLLASMEQAVAIAEEHDVILAFEPEVANVVDSPAQARRLLDEIASPRLRVCMDGANIFHAGDLSRMGEVLDEAFELLGGDIALAHAKDLDHDGDAGHLPAGRGLLDYTLYLTLLQKSGYSGALILHGLADADVDGCLAFLRDRIAATAPAPLE